MRDDLAILKALRERLLATVVVTTGVTSLGVSGNAFTRSAGSFVDDGFTEGMEVIPNGFGFTTPVILTYVSDIVMTSLTPIADEAEGPGRSLTVGIPTIQGWEGLSPKRLDNRWEIDEDYLPGPSAKVNVGIGGQLHHTPVYVVKLYGLNGYGPNALYTVAGGILNRFPPGLPLLNGDPMPLRVSTDPAPYRGQMLPDSEDAGRSVIVITIPLWKRTLNPI